MPTKVISKYRKPSKPAPGKRRNMTRLDAPTGRTKTKPPRKTRWVRKVVPE